MGVISRSFPPHPNPLPRGEGRPFIPPAKLGGILAHFDKNFYSVIPQSRGVGATSACLHEAFRRRQVALNREDFGVSGSTELAEVSAER